MNDLDLLDRFGPTPTEPSPAALAGARARLDTAIAGVSAKGPRSRRRLPLVAAAAAAAGVGLAVTPAFLDSDGSIALASVDPMTFPLTPTGLPAGLADPVFERDLGFMAARYGTMPDVVSIVTDVDDEDFWTVPDDATTVDVNGQEGAVYSRTVHNGSATSAPAVTVVWQDDDGGWTAVTGSGAYADATQVEAMAESLQDEPQPVDLALEVAPQGWPVLAYKEDRILTLDGPGEGEHADLSVSLVDAPVPDLSGYGAQDVESLTINGESALLGRQDVGVGERTWILVAQTASGQAFSLQAPAALTRDQVVRVAEGVAYRPHASSMSAK